MRILGVDPGSLATGWGLVAGSSRDPVLIDCGVIRLVAEQPLAARLAELHDALRAIVERLGPTAAAVESPFHGASARSALHLAHARGVVLAALASCHVPIGEYAPAAVKKTVSGNGRADKHQVAVAVGYALGVAGGTLKHDASDALAVALCHLATSSQMVAVPAGNMPRWPRGRGAVP